MYHLFIDFMAANDTIDRNTMYHFPGKLIRLLMATMNGMQCKVRIS